MACHTAYRSTPATDATQMSMDTETPPADVAALLARLAAHRFDDPAAAFSFSQRLARDNGWTHAYALRVIDEYRRFAALAVLAGHPVTPSDQVDQVWHQHLCYSRDYWQTFCPQVLGTPLHHGPTLGGGAERAKYRDGYLRTLASYRRLFGEWPPADIWPDPQQRFGRDLAQVRVNRHDYWLLPRPRCSRLGIGLSALAAFMLGGCTLLELPAQLLTMSGHQFLMYYLPSALLALFVALLLRLALRSPGAYDPRDRAPQLSVAEAACLADGPQRVVDSSLLAMIQRGLVSVSEDGRRLAFIGDARSLGDPLERTIAGAIAHDPRPQAVRRAASGRASAALAPLRAAGLLVAQRRSLSVRLLPALICSAMLVLALFRIGLGLYRDRPVGFLVFFSLLYLGPTLWLWFGRVHRSRRGERVLGELRHQVRPRTVARLEDPVVPLVVALFGLSAVGALLPLPLRELLVPTSADSGSSGADGSSSDDGGGGGDGGCGGCGGGD